MTPYNTERTAHASIRTEDELPAIPDLGALVEVVHEMRVMALSGIHGEGHWRRVAVAGAEGGGTSVGRQM